MQENHLKHTLIFTSFYGKLPGFFDVDLIQFNSIAFRTALAEAELEYDPQYKSKEVYVSFPIQKPPQVAQNFLNGYVFMLPFRFG